MKIKRTALLLTLLLLALFCLSCTASPALVGRWQTEVEDEELGKILLVYHFTEENEIFLEQKNGDEIPFSIFFGTYHVQGDTIVIDDKNSTTQFTFSVDQNHLSFFLDGKRQMIFERV